jgi:hypothetical protein
MTCIAAELALSAAPGILRDVSADYLAWLRLAVEIRIAGLSVPGIDMAWPAMSAGRGSLPRIAS